MIAGVNGIATASLLRLPGDSTNPQPVDQIFATSAANFESGLPAPGSLAAIFCTGLNVPAGVTQGGPVPLPTTLAGIRVTIGGTPAPILAIANSGSVQQVNVQVPVEAASATIVIEGPALGLATSSAFRTSPGDFFTNADGSGIFQHASDYFLVTPQNPARRGEPIIAYLTGVAAAGVMTTNSPAPSDPLVSVPQYSHAAGASTYSVTIGGVSVTPTFFGLAPGLIGVFQLNLVVPFGIAHGVQQVSLAHYTCSGNFFGTCGVNNGNPATVSSSAVTIPIE